jgi:hypothetical protein
MARSNRTLEASLTKTANHLASATHSTSASLRWLQSSMTSISSSWLSQGLIPQDYASTSAASRKSGSHSLPSSWTFFSPSMLSRLRELLVQAMCASILSRYSFRVASAFAHSASRSALTLTTTFLEISAFSYRTRRISSHRVSSSPMQEAALAALLPLLTPSQ